MASGGNGQLDKHDSSALQSLELESFEDVTSLLGPPPKKKRMPWLPGSGFGTLKYKEPFPQSSLPKDIRDMNQIEEENGEGGGGSRKRRSWKRLWSLRSFDRRRKGRQGFSPLALGEGDHWCPEEDASLLSKLFFAFCNSLMTLGAQKTLNQEDLWSLASCDKASAIVAAFERNLEATKNPEKRPQGSVGWALWRTHRKMFMLAGVLKLGHDIVQFGGPFLLRLVLQNLQSDESNAAHILKGFFLALAMSAASFLTTILLNQYFHMLFRIGLHIKAQLVTMLYHKALRLTSSSKAEQGTGAIVNLQSNDAFQLWMVPQFLHGLWSGPFQILTTMGLLVKIIGWPGAFSGFAVACALIPLNIFVGKKFDQYRKAQMKYTDQRVKLTTEVITGIKAIKLYSWEKPYLEKISKLREQELKQLWKTRLIMLFYQTIVISGPIMVSLAGFGTYAAMGGKITAAVAFPALAFFNLLQSPITMMPMQILFFIFCRVALNRIQKFINSEEIEEMPEGGGSGKVMISIPGTSFAWAPDAPDTLHNVNLNVQHGQLLMVIGEVGSGKSSLLASILGEMHQNSGSVSVQGSVAYTAQDPWIQNATVENNILMGNPMDRDRYAAVISACALLPDLQLLSGGDQTEIGEKGVTLSGGQKHRIALARACYADRDVVLLDDPLSAVDAHVGRHLFEKCICRFLAGKTRVLVTHQLQFLPEADIVVILQSGQITAIGTYDDLRTKGINFHEFEIKSENDAHDVGDECESSSSSGSDGGDRSPNGRDPGNENDSNDTETVIINSKASIKEHQKELDKLLMKKDGKITEAEERTVGRVKTAVYTTYLRAWGPFFIIPIFLFVNSLGEKGLQVGQNFWLAIWSSHSEEIEDLSKDPQQAKYITIYFGLGLASMCFSLFGEIWVLIGNLNASRKLLMNLIHKVAHLPMSFFDTQPSGRLINRFTRDTEAMDTTVALIYQMTLGSLVSVFLSLFVVSAVTLGLNLVFILVLGVLYVRIQKRYLATTRELKRLDSLALSPIFGHFNETLAGLETVRAFKKQGDFKAKNEILVNESNRAFWPLMSVGRWLSINLDLMSGFIIFLTAVTVTVIFRSNAGFAGLALTSALNLTGVLNMLIREITQLEVDMNSIERIVEYMKYDTEKDDIVPDNRPPAGWPSKGAITVDNLCVRYRPELDDVLKGISFSVAGCEKIGVCGRTGCGKSTLTMSLYRIVEASGGSIVIDGVDISKIGMYDLRSNLSLVPQDPVIFSGTVRSNLDPFGTARGDAQVWNALTQSGMNEFVRGMEGGLDAEISEGGGNLSVGQRQLLCMARALLRGSRILILDEATSNVDSATDSLIQQTIRTAFKDCTVLTIAHRLHTIINCDRILLLDNGTVQEFDTPERLLKDPNSAFSKLVEEASRTQRGSRKRTKSSVALTAEIKKMQGEA